MKILFFFFLIIFHVWDIVVAMVTYMISQVEESFLLRRAAGSFITLYPSFMTFLWQVFYDRWQLKLHYRVLLFQKWILKKVVFYVGISSVPIK